MWRLLFWSAWRLPDRAVAVVVAVDPDRDTTVGCPECPAMGGRCPVPAWVVARVGMDLPPRKRFALIVDADLSRGRDGAAAAVLGKVVTAEVRALTSAKAARSVPAEGKDSGEAEVSIPARAEVKAGNLAAARLLALVAAADPVRTGARDLVPAEVGQCTLAAARDLASAAEVDSAPAPDRAEARTLNPAGGQVKMDQV
ncbi:MAG: hypothetical protein ISS70_09285 [Phycisphaerae bacterium]|nr:hypothetical protein [Phycisphaerae bacterium]